MAERKTQRPYKQVARAQAQERTRETLLQAASEEVERDGWRQASLETVAERAGVTKQTALRHFGSKQGLLDAVVRRTSAIVVKERNKAPIGDIAGAVANLTRHYGRYGDLMMRLLPYRDAVVRVLGEEHRDWLARRAVDHGHQVHKDWVLRTFEPQLAQLSGEARERRLAQLVTVCDVYTWKVLHRDLSLSAAQTEAAILELIERLVEPDATPPKPARKRSSSAAKPAQKHSTPAPPQQRKRS